MLTTMRSGSATGAPLLELIIRLRRGIDTHAQRSSPVTRRRSDGAAPRALALPSRSAGSRAAPRGDGSRRRSSPRCPSAASPWARYADRSPEPTGIGETTPASRVDSMTMSSRSAAATATPRMPSTGASRVAAQRRQRERADHRPDSVSGGMRASRALATRPAPSPRTTARRTAMPTMSGVTRAKIRCVRYTPR